MTTPRLISAVLSLLTLLTISLPAYSQDINDRLLTAVLSGDNAAVQDLLAKGADPKSKQGAGALVRAAILGNTSIVKALLDKGADVDARDSSGETPLMVAATWGRTAVVQMLIARGANVNAKSAHGNTPLILAVGGGDVSGVQALIAKGADVNTKNNDEETSLMLAERFERKDIAQTLVAAGAIKTALVERKAKPVGSTEALSVTPTDGIPRKLVLKNVRLSQGDLPSSFTIRHSGVAVNVYKVTLDSPGDQIRMVQLASVVSPLGDKSVVRFIGRIPFPLENATASAATLFKIEGWATYNVSGNNSVLYNGTPTEGHAIFNGEESSPLTFTLLKDIGFVYLRGKGTVETSDGKMYRFP